MKKTGSVIRWIGVAIFWIMTAYALSEKSFFSALMFFLDGTIIAPLSTVQKIRGKLKLNKALSIILVVVFLFAGALAIPTDEASINKPQASDNVLNSATTTNSTNSLLVTSTVSTTDTANVPATIVPQETQTPEITATPKPTVTVKPTAQTGEQNSVNILNIPAYSGKAYVVINDNIPRFSSTELKTTGYETYSNLDNLGRTQTAIACVGKDTMPKEDEERGSISSIKPTGWKQATYDNISGKYLYNRCHLIGWQLSAENANKKNLITGTKYLNINGMLPFENIVADYIKETGNHVAYRITPMYQGNNLLASGVQMEAFSVEDNGAGICFNVYCYNVQPGILINYVDGSSSLKTNR